MGQGAERPDIHMAVVYALRVLERDPAFEGAAAPEGFADVGVEPGLMARRVPGPGLEDPAGSTGQPEAAGPRSVHLGHVPRQPGARAVAQLGGPRQRHVCFEQWRRWSLCLRRRLHVRVAAATASEEAPQPAADVRAADGRPRLDAAAPVVDPARAVPPWGAAGRQAATAARRWSPGRLPGAPAAAPAPSAELLAGTAAAAAAPVLTTAVGHRATE